MASPSIIKTYARLHPDSPCHDYVVDNTSIGLQIPDPFHSHLRQSVSHRFHFDRVFSGETGQQELFDVVAKDVVQGFLSGYNGTIFAYGQTGSGKTHSMHGDGGCNNRGIAPRALSMIYSELEKRVNEESEVRVSFLEIYQEVGYDLLSAPVGKNTSLIAPQFPKVGVFEGVDGCITRNLSSHLATTETMAQTMLEQGEANRRVAETPVNARSSRSHAVFTVSLSTRKYDTDTILKSKLHLVDLAGSERCAKTGANGAQLAEAKCINLSLHHLESVIIGLQQDAGQKNIGPWAKSKIHSLFSPYNTSTRRLKRPHTSGGRMTSSSANRHIPYRNSLLTMILRDSLGGNCLTAMIATVNMALENVGETISTCRFAQRVACIKNMARKNEDFDDKALIKQLRRQIGILEAELNLLRSGTISDIGDMSSDQERNWCEDLMKKYVGGTVADPVLEGVITVPRFQHCLHVLKTMITQHVCSLENDDDVIIPMTSSSHKCIKTSADDVTVTKNDVSPPGMSGVDLSTFPTSAKRNLSPTSTFSFLNGDVDISTGVNSDSTSFMITPTSFKLESTSPSEEIPSQRPTLLKTLSTSDDVITSNDVIQPETPRSQRIFSAPPRVRKPRVTNDDVRMSDDVTASDDVRPVSAEPRQTRSKRATSVSLTSSVTSLDQVPTTTQKERYRTPFEKQRDRAAQRLHQRVEKLTVETATIDQDIETRRQEIRQQQLTVLKRELEHKLSQSKALLRKQEETIDRLLTEQADSQILTDEHLVKRNLKYRTSKIEKRLKAVSDKLDTTNPDQHEPPKTKSLEEKFPRYVKQDGGYSANYLIDLLQAEEKMKKKQQSRLINKRITTMAMEMEVKEMATRQRLREFKEKIKHQKPYTIRTENDTNHNEMVSNESDNCRKDMNVSNASEDNVFANKTENHDDNSTEIVRAPPNRSQIVMNRNSDNQHERKFADTGPSSKNHNDDLYSEFQNRKLEKIAKKMETRSSSFIPDVNLHGIRSSNQSSRQIKSEHFDIEDFVAKCNRLNLSESLRKCSINPAFTSIDVRNSSAGLSKSGENAFPESSRKLALFTKVKSRNGSAKECENTGLANDYKSEPVEVVKDEKNNEDEIKGVKDIERKQDGVDNDKCEKREIDELQGTNQQQIMIVGKSLDQKFDKLTNKESFFELITNGEKFKEERQSSSKRGDKPRNGIKKSIDSSLVFRPSSSNVRRHTKSEFKIDWSKGIIHINGNDKPCEVPKKSRSKRKEFLSKCYSEQVNSRTIVNGESRNSVNESKSSENSNQISVDSVSRKIEIKHVFNQNGDPSNTLEVSGSKNFGERKSKSENIFRDEKPEQLKDYTNLEQFSREMRLKPSALELNIQQSAREQKLRVQRLRQAQSSAAIIQRAWKRHRASLVSA